MADRPPSRENESLSQHHAASQSITVPRSAQTKEALSRSPVVGHRQSFGENLRGVPPSPRTQRHPSLSQQALQDLLNDPPVRGNGETRPQARDWRNIHVGEVMHEQELQFVSIDANVETATNLLVSSIANVVLISETPESRTVIGTYDYVDLNSYLLLVVGLAQPEEGQAQSFKELAQKGREGKPIPLKDVKDLGKKEPIITLPETANLTKAMEVFGSGIHRILVVKENTTNVIGVLTQLRLLRFFWENRNSFPAIEPLYTRILKDVDIGSHSVFAINGDKPLTTALELMNNEGVTSLPVLDAQRNVIGNISNVDVRLLTKSTSLPLLSASCIHFISVILSERGVNDGKDSFPVFHVNPYSTVAHTVAKLVATRSHRMWVVDNPSPSSSTPATPVTTPAVLVPPTPYNSGTSAVTPHTAPAPSVSASALPGATLSGRLSGVVSLTDILNLFARASGLHPHDPDEMRRHRRRSSSSSVRKSVDSSRSESLSGAELSGSAIMSGVGVGRSASIPGKRGT